MPIASHKQPPRNSWGAARGAVREKASFSVALAGGSTPKALYELLAGDPLPAGKSTVEQYPVFSLGHERHVPADQRGEQLSHGPGSDARQSPN